MKKRIYFVAESTVDGENIQSEKFNQLVNPKTDMTIFNDVFQITDCKEFESYSDKEDFIATMLDMSYSYFENFGDEIGEILLVAVEEKTDVFLWGVKMKLLEDDTFQYTTMDYKSSGYTLKFESREGKECC